MNRRSTPQGALRSRSTARTAIRRLWLRMRRAGSGAFLAGVVFALALLPAVPATAQLDLVFANEDENRLCRNTGTGSFTCSNASSSTSDSRDVAVGDFDGVNGPDLAFPNLGINGVCLNTGTGSFTCSNVSHDANNSSGVAVGDFDGMNGLDLAFANSGQANRVCLNTGAGSFTCASVSDDTNQSVNVAAGDFDGMNGLDLAFANFGINRVCLNQGGSQLTFACSDVSDDSYESTGVAVGDFDSVNGPDLAFSNYGFDFNEPDQVCLNTGVGSFTCSDVGSGFFTLGFDVAVGDFDGANGPDLVFAYDLLTQPEVCLNAGTGSFTCSSVSNGIGASDLAAGVGVGDVDGVNGPDFVLAMADGPNRVCLNTGSGGFSCSDVSDDDNNTRDVAMGDFGDPPLPVELTSFTATTDDPDVLLAWETATETNNAGFELQQAFAEASEPIRAGLVPAPASPWHAVGFIEGHGTTTTVHTYTHRVPGLAPGTHRFRLKQIDFDGRFAYSPEVEVALELAEAYHLSAPYPNPFNPQARFRLVVQQTQAVEVGVYDGLGRRVAGLYSGVMEGQRAYPFVVEGQGLPSGVYVIRAEGERFRATRPVMLVK